MPGVELASDRDESLAVDGERFELRDRPGWELLREEAHLVALRIRRDPGQRVPAHDLGELVAGAHDDVDLEPEALNDQLPRPPRDRFGLQARRQDEVAALQV